MVAFNDDMGTVLSLACHTSFDYFSVPGSSTRDGEAEFVASYDPSKYGLNRDSVVYTADASVFTVMDGILNILLIKRGNHPFKGYWCLPGGFVDSEDKNTAVTVVRELAEETGLTISVDPVFVGKYDFPWRDPRMEHIVSYCYGFIVEERQAVKGADDASDAAWVPVTSVLTGEVSLGFDHLLLVKDAILKMVGNENNTNQPLVE